MALYFEKELKKTLQDIECPSDIFNYEIKKINDEELLEHIKQLLDISHGIKCKNGINWIKYNFLREIDMYNDIDMLLSLCNRLIFIFNSLILRESNRHIEWKKQIPKLIKKSYKVIPFMYLTKEFYFQPLFRNLKINNYAVSKDLNIELLELCPYKEI